MYDVIVVGARVAGSATAMLFARQGCRVLMVDRARFPSDTLSTHYLQQPGVALLADWGVLDDIVATGCPALDRAVYQVADVRLAGCSTPARGQRAAYAPRRQLLDQILIDAAVAAGVEFREATSLAEVVFEDDRAVGVVCRSKGGLPVRENARLVVGADGMRSSVAKGVGAPLVVDDPRMTCMYYTYWHGVPADFELYERPGRWVGSVPTNDATLVAAYFPQDEFDAVRGDALGNYLANVRETAPDLHERLMDGEQLERLRGTGDQLNFFRQASGPGWALVGDAAHHKDSITARGITDAFLQADFLVSAVGPDLADPGRLAVGLAKYAREHHALLLESYQSTIIVSNLEVTEERLTLLRAIGESQELTDRYFGAASGALTMTDLYTEDLLAML